MAKDIKVYDLLISCPSDVSEYVEMLEKEVNHFNNFFGRKNNIIVRTRHWSKDSYSEFGNQPQELLNKQIVDSSDMALGVFWTSLEHLQKIMALERKKKLKECFLWGSKFSYIF